MSPNHHPSRLCYSGDFIPFFLFIFAIYVCICFFIATRCLVGALYNIARKHHCTQLHCTILPLMCIIKSVVVFLSSLHSLHSMLIAESEDIMITIIIYQSIETAVASMLQMFHQPPPLLSILTCRWKRARVANALLGTLSLSLYLSLCRLVRHKQAASASVVAASAAAAVEAHSSVTVSTLLPTGCSRRRCSLCLQIYRLSTLAQ